MGKCDYLKYHFECTLGFKSSLTCIYRPTIDIKKKPCYNNKKEERKAKLQKIYSNYEME